MYHFKAMHLLLFLFKIAYKKQTKISKFQEILVNGFDKGADAITPAKKERN